MAAPTYPPPLLEPIAADAGGAYITDPIPEAPTGSNAASIQGGFPPVTMQSELGGGEPPLGQDFNGFLFMITTHTVWVQSGQLYQFNSTLAADIGGYAVGTILGMADGSGMWICVAANNTTNPDTTAAVGWRPVYSYGSQSIPVSSGTVSLTVAQGKKPVLIFTGILTGNVTVVLPDFAQSWLLVNATSGAFTLQAINGGGAGVTVPQGGFASPLGVYSIGDGNLYPTVAPLSIPISQAATPLTIVERTNAGYILATYFNSSAPPNEDTTAAYVAVQNGDGYIRFATLAFFEASMALSAIGGQVANGQVPYSVVQQWAATLFTSPAFTGVPTAPTAATGTATSQLATTAFVNPGASLGVNGYRRNPDGSIEQWGILNKTASTVNAPVVFPITFPSQVFNIQLTTENTTGTVSGYSQDISDGSITLSGFSITGAAFGGGAPNPNVNVHWRAIGR